ncbi:MAG: acyl carrier protein [Planctomycetota bacterium]|nr:MAG: acyl carrier protein [Planctomycetota bacterium]
MVDKNKIFDGLVKYLIGESILDLKISDITLETDIREDMGFDSLQLNTMILDLEDQYNIEFNDEVSQLKTVGEVVELIVEKVGFWFR